MGMPKEIKLKMVKVYEQSGDRNGNSDTIST